MLFLVIDQGGAEALARYRPLFQGGLARLFAESVDFADAHHDHAMTATAPGHATLATGMYPAHHGIIANYWRDRETGEDVYAVGDEELGRSPRRLLVTALGDWMQATWPQSKVFAAAGKDRAAILSGGRDADGAWWYDWDRGKFETSEYYPPQEPEWLAELHGRHWPDQFWGQSWTPLPEVEAAAAAYGVERLDRGLIPRYFPHPLGGLSLVPDKAFYGSVGDTPLLDSYLAELAKALITGEQLGQDAFPDLLALSFSALDIAGHDYGPDSPEFLDTLLRLDRTLGELLDFVDRTVGLDHVVVSLSADHGVLAVPEVLQARGDTQARRLNAADLACIQAAGAGITEQYGDGWWRDDFYLDIAGLESRGADVAALERELQQRLQGCSAISRVWTRAELLAGKPEGADDPLFPLFLHSFHPERSEDLTIEWAEKLLPGLYTEATHGSPYPYDTHVPWLLRLPGAQPKVVAQRVHTVDVAPTLAHLLGVTPPAGLDGVDRGDLLRP